MTIRFDLHVTFTGMCVLLYKGPKEAPTEAEVVLTDGTGHSGHHKHVPRMIYRPEDLLLDDSTSQQHHRLVSDPTGEDLAVLELKEKVTVPDPTSSGFHALWTGNGVEPKTGEETSLRWLPSIYRINSAHVGRPDPTKPHHGLKSVVATVKLKGGSLEAGNLTRDRLGKYVVAQFEHRAGGGGGADNQVLADKLHLRISGIDDFIEISGKTPAGASWRAALQPAARPGNPTGSGRVEIAIVNLPVESHPGLPPARLEHFGHYYDMFSWPAGKPDLRLPKLSGQVATGSSGVCPPARFD